MRGPAALDFKEAWNFLTSMRNEECAGMSWNAHPKIILRGWIVWKTTTQINTAEDWLLRLCKQWLNDLIIHSLSYSYRFVHITKTVKNIYLSQSSSKLQICVFSAHSVMARLLELLLRLPPVLTTRCPRVYGSKGPWALFFLKNHGPGHHIMGFVILLRYLWKLKLEDEGNFPRIWHKVTPEKKTRITIRFKIWRTDLGFVGLNKTWHNTLWDCPWSIPVISFSLVTVIKTSFSSEYSPLFRCWSSYRPS